ncbi:unnamed protein product [Lactuca virosa]|uniref:Uncharacterized protein n=1 Tax=Lactuca virosa TaxID=75947 RepID=A0AAU9LF91_9ASTR|nr:unnamed protein product [Lactuca virosa]
MKRGSTLSNKSCTFLGALVVLMLIIQQGSAGLYSCWGGCLNECFLFSSKRIGESFPCYVNCFLGKCLSQPPGQTSLGTPPRLVNHPSPLHAPSPSDSEAYQDYFIDKAYEIHRYHLHNCIKDCSLQTYWFATNGEKDIKGCLTRCINKCTDLNI